MRNTSGRGCEVLYFVLYSRGCGTTAATATLAWMIKFAFIDSWMMVRMMNGYMQVAPTTTITFDLYTQLSGFPSSFKKLFNESRITPGTTTVVTQPYTSAQSPVETPVTVPVTKAVTETASEQVAESEPSPAKESAKPRFCYECGTPLKTGMVFCGNCEKNGINDFFKEILMIPE